jgi:hypothetical protein
MFNDILLKLTKRLFPKGRAFRIITDGFLEKLNKGLIISENAAYVSALSVLDSILPDNDNFTVEDATDWERRLGLITNEVIPLADRKLAILRKMNHPGTVKTRQHYLYLQKQLNDAGFDVKVYENRFPAAPIIPEQMGIMEMGIGEMGGNVSNPVKYETFDPDTFYSGKCEMGTGEMGDMEMGCTIDYSLVANHIDEDLDSRFLISFKGAIDEMGTGEMGVMEMGGTFDYAAGLRSTFFVAGDTFNGSVNVSFARKQEFRQLILKTKPVQTIGILVVNYV